MLKFPGSPAETLNFLTTFFWLFSLAFSLPRGDPTLLDQPLDEQRGNDFKGFEDPPDTWMCGSRLYETCQEAELSPTFSS